ncbi:tripartite tricarboxylate transporter substrate-binding protein [Bordetella sp. LUAb4]|uniref:tripartite tricarboxylate transporter substrate-binding protein n=1 Tax=Bordetella sp. LUAb4 TaxID=2843195 RepID=UPI001E51F252|nr:tripartite tricarboxylate transporter substrate-binding protein [Bordetella sp. LUAb4]
MQFTHRKLWAASMAASVMPFSAHASLVENVYPNKRVTIVVGGSQGIGVDIISRHLAKELHRELRVDVIVENRPGATGNIAAEFVARSVPDGYTLFIASRPNVTYGALQEHPRYDMRRDLQSVGLVATAPTVIVAGRGSKITSTEELIARARANPNSVKCASTGVGSTGHLLCEELQQAAKMEVMHIPYNQIDQAFTHIIGGHVDMIFITLSAALPYIRSGAVQAIAISGNERSPTAPDIPTFQEKGLVNLHGDAWFGLVVAAGTPPKVVETLNLALNRVLAQPLLRDQLLDLGYVLPRQPNGVAALERLISEEAAHWTDLIAERGIVTVRH